MPYNLIILSLYFLLITLSVIGYGLILNRLIGERNSSINFGYLGILGIFLLTIYSYASNLVIAHGVYHNTIILILGLIAFFVLIKNEVSLRNNQSKLLFFVFFFLFCGLFISKNHDDFSYYHFPYTYYISQHSLIFGVGQFGHGFRTPSSIFYLNSLFFLPFAKFHLLNISYLLVLGFANIILINKILSNFKKKIFNNDNLFINFISLLSLLFVNIFFYRLSEYGTDRSAQILVIILIIELLSLNFLYKIKQTNLIYIYILSALVVSIKAFFILYIIFIIPLFYIIYKSKKNIIKTFIFLSFNKYSLMFTLSLCFVLFSNFTNTGCFLYPVSFSCVENLSWSIPKEQVIMMNNHYEIWSKAGAGPNFRVEDPNNYISDFNWVPNWVNEYFFNKVSDLLFGLIFLIIIVFFIFRINVFKKGNYHINTYYKLIYAVLLIIFIEWFVNHPALRYGGYCVILMLLLIPLALKITNHKLGFEKFYNYSIILIFLSFLIFNGRNISRVINEVKQYNYNPVKYSFYKLNKSDFRVEKKMSEFLTTYYHCKNEDVKCDKSKLKVKNKFGKLIFIK